MRAMSAYIIAPEMYRTFVSSNMRHDKYGDYFGVGKTVWFVTMCLLSSIEFFKRFL